MSTQLEMPRENEACTQGSRADDLSPLLRDIAFVLHLTRRVKQEMAGAPETLSSADPGRTVQAVS